MGFDHTLDRLGEVCYGKVLAGDNHLASARTLRSELALKAKDKCSSKTLPVGFNELFREGKSPASRKAEEKHSMMSGIQEQEVFGDRTALPHCCEGAAFKQKLTLLSLHHGKGERRQGRII